MFKHCAFCKSEKLRSYTIKDFWEFNGQEIKIDEPINGAMCEDCGSIGYTKEDFEKLGIVVPKGDQDPFEPGVGSLNQPL